MTIVNYIDLTDNTTSSANALTNDEQGKPLKTYVFFYSFNSNMYSKTCKKID